MTLADTDLLAQLLDGCPDAVIVANVRGRVLVLNEAAQRLCRVGVADIRAGIHAADLYYRREEARQVASRLRARAAGVSPLDDQMDVALRASNGDIVPARLTVSFLHDSRSAIVGTLGVFTDRRESRALEQRLVDVTGQVEAVERRAASIAVAAAASHELSQPLTAALGLVEMLQMDPSLGPSVSDRLDRVATQLDRMRRIVREFTRSVTTYVAARSEQG